MSSYLISLSIIDYVPYFFSFYASFVVILILIVSLLASLLTFFSGFGLGTLLTPIVALFFPIKTAIAITAMVHLLNNLFKLQLTGKYTDWNIVKKFGIPALIGSLAGALLLYVLPDSMPIISYTLWGNHFDLYTTKIIIGILIILFTIIEGNERIKNWTAQPNYLQFGGLLSGFFGGLSGHQGALRSMFLLKSNLSKQSFIASGIAIACIIDFSRLFVYIPQWKNLSWSQEGYLVIMATLAAFAGAYIGNKFLNKSTWPVLQKFVSIMLILIGLAMILGLV